jgi:hypothetical protein
MNVSDVAIIASIIAGIVAIPFTVSTIFQEYEPISTSILQTGDTSKFPGKLSKSLTSESFEQTFRTPFGEFTVKIKADNIYQELVRPNRRVRVEETPEFTRWELVTNNYTLVVQRTGEELSESFSSPEGSLIKTKKMGNITEEVSGNVEKVRENYERAKTILDEEVQRMKKLTLEYMTLPGTLPTTVVINEFSVGNTTWIELYNKAGKNVSLTGWTIEDNTANPKSLDGKVISANGYLLLNKTAGDFGFTLNTGGDIIILRKDGKTIDKVAYGDYNDGDVSDNAPAPPCEKSAGRYPNGKDTDIDVNDFKIFETPTPGTSNG